MASTPTSGSAGSGSRPRPLDRPRRLGRYELLAPIGTGGMATVYLGRVRGVGGFERLVAVKVCHANLREQADFVSMFLDEARLAARIHHPNVVSTLDVVDEEELYLVMDYVEGGHLAKLWKAASRDNERLPIPIILRVVHDAAMGLHAVHETCDHDGQPLNLIHRDVSPQNILVGTDGAARISDFGVVKAEARIAATRPGDVKGKFPYMAPEQILGQPLTGKADVFSLSVVLWESLAGDRLFKSTSEADTCDRVLNEPIRPPSQLRPDVPAHLDTLALWGLERDAGKRLESALKLAHGLERCGAVLASPADVGAYVARRLAKSIAAHREVLRHTMPDIPVVDLDITPSGPAAPLEPTEPGADQTSTELGPGAASRWRVLGVALAAIALAAVAGVFIAMSRDDGDHARVTPAAVGPLEPEAADAGAETGPPEAAPPVAPAPRVTVAPVAALDAGDEGSKAVSDADARAEATPARPPSKRRPPVVRRPRPEKVAPERDKTGGEYRPSSI